ncbi:MAG: glutaredoxin domain-containing protein [Actinomycetaceae bacterium]|nr:glutaredoxin domain-containing protein [Actinomycetaceae bacterium]
MTTPDNTAGIEAFEHTVVVFAKPNCVQCDATQRKLQRAGVAYQSVDLTTNPELVETLRSLGFAAAPVVRGPDGQMHAGYNPDRIKSIIAAMGNATGNLPNPQSDTPLPTIPNTPVTQQRNNPRR